MGASALVLSGCGSSSSSGYGKKGDAAKATRTIDVKQLDTLKFDPSAITVKPGETVKFRVTNGGSQLHEFVLGDQKVQDDHEKEMKDMAADNMKMADGDNRIDLDPGQTKELTWTFPSKGTVIYGCHVPGHFLAGMKGTVTT